MAIEEVIAKSMTESWKTAVAANGDERQWIALHELRPFDVLLTRPKDAKSSKVIASLTEGPFSHAAVFVGRFLCFESVQEGVRFSTWLPDVVRRIDGKLELLRSVAHYEEIRVRRHVELADLNEEGINAMQRVLVGLTSRFNALAYPPPSAFALIAERLGLPSPIVDFVKTVGKTTEATGPFCSELVCRVMEAAEYPAVEKLVANEVTPNTLGESPQLKDVKEALVSTTADGVHRDLTLAARLTPLRLERALAGFDSRKKMLGNVAELREEFEKQVKDASTGPDRLARANVAMTACVANVMSYEREQVENALVDESAFVTSAADERTVLASALGRCLTRFGVAEPPEPRLLRPLREFLDDVAAPWEKWAKDFRVNLSL